MKVNKQAYNTCKQTAHIVGSTAVGGGIASAVLMHVLSGDKSVINKAISTAVAGLTTGPLMAAADLFVASTCPIYAKTIYAIPGAADMLKLSGEEMNIDIF
jgi:hypothetical protein